jgi:hypothetical protein
MRTFEGEAARFFNIHTLPRRKYFYPLRTCCDLAALVGPELFSAVQFGCCTIHVQHPRPLFFFRIPAAHVRSVCMELQSPRRSSLR